MNRIKDRRCMGTYVFANYSKNDKTTVSVFVNALSENNLFICTSENSDSYYISDAIVSVINMCNVFLIFISKNSLKSKWLGIEIDLILEYIKLNPNSSVNPIILDGSRLPISLEKYPPINIHESIETAVKQLMNVLKQ